MVSNASVDVRNPSTGISTKVSTNGQGLYTAPDLKAGVYEVSVSARGFESVTKTGIELRVQDRVAVDFDLKIGQSSTSVSVEAKAPALQTETSSLGQVVGTIFPTVTHQIGGTLPDKPLDGIDIWPILSGEKKSIERDALLYFDNWDLQCARWNSWKLHVARHNSSTYSGTPAGGRHNFILPHPELYNLAEDPEESYDVAPSHPEIVAQIQGRIETLLAGFPAPVKQAYAESKARKVDPAMPIGARPHPAAE